MATLTYDELIESLKRGEWSESAGERKAMHSPSEAECERWSGYEFNEKSPLPSECEPEAMLGTERGVLTVADMPELERRLRLSGWKVERRGDELLCWTGRKMRTQ